MGGGQAGVLTTGTRRSVSAGPLPGRSTRARRISCWGPPVKTHPDTPNNTNICHLAQNDCVTTANDVPWGTAEQTNKYIQLFFGVFSPIRSSVRIHVVQRIVLPKADKQQSCGRTIFYIFFLGHDRSPCPESQTHPTREPAGFWPQPSPALRCMARDRRGCTRYLTRRVHHYLWPEHLRVGADAILSIPKVTICSSSSVGSVGNKRHENRPHRTYPNCELNPVPST